jgi:sugar lactone lactonase YvrE
MRLLRSALGALVAFAAAGAIVSASGAAGSATGILVVAKNLNNPRGVFALPDGRIYVAEAGRAGTTCPTKELCYGFSGSITRYRDARQARVLRNLVSVGGRDGTFVTGPNGVSVDPQGVFYIAMTAAPSCRKTDDLPDNARGALGKLMRWQQGKLEAVVDLNALECARNFDHADRNANPYAVLALGNGHEVVVDAGANTLYDVQGKNARVLAVFPKTRGGAQSVPTSVALGPDDAYYVGEFVGELPGGKPTLGAGRVWKVVPGQKPVVYKTGFNAISGIAFGSDGTLYVTQFTNNPRNEENLRGAVVRITSDGKRTLHGVGRLFLPSGAAVGADGALYVSNWSILPGAPLTAGPFAGKTGELVQITF